MFIVSEEVNAILHRWNIFPDNIYVTSSPARSRAARNAILAVERKFKPDVVYTMAGPTYVNFESLHVMGISDPYITHADFMSLFLNRSWYEACLFGFKEFLKGWYSRMSADYFLFQTETSRDGFCNRYHFDRDKTSLLQNALGESFLALPSVVEFVDATTKKIFVPSAYYAHKNLNIIFKICQLLKDSGDSQEYLFITTVPKDSVFNRDIEALGLLSMIHNIGPYAYNDAHKLYAESDAVFIPSILETFSTSYLEAIAMSKPLIVADRPFSREVCN